MGGSFLAEVRDEKYRSNGSAVRRGAPHRLVPGSLGFYPHLPSDLADLSKRAPCAVARGVLPSCPDGLGLDGRWPWVWVAAVPRPRAHRCWPSEPLGSWGRPRCRGSPRVSLFSRLKIILVDFSVCENSRCCFLRCCLPVLRASSRSARPVSQRRPVLVVCSVDTADIPQFPEFALRCP